MLLNPCLLIICLFPFEVRAEVVSAPCDMIVIIIIEPHQHLSDLIRVELVQQVVYHEHANFVPVDSCCFIGVTGRSMCISQEI